MTLVVIVLTKPFLQSQPIYSRSFHGYLYPALPVCNYVGVSSSTTTPKISRERHIVRIRIHIRMERKRRRGGKTRYYWLLWWRERKGNHFELFPSLSPAGLFEFYPFQEIWQRPVVVIVVAIVSIASLQFKRPSSSNRRSG